METKRFDVAVIGAGTAGLNARQAAVDAGAHTVLINAGLQGTTCVRVGCMPSKLLLAAANVARDIGHAETFGIRVSAPRIDGRAVMARLRREREVFLKSIYEQVDAIPDGDRIDARARFVGPTTLALDDGSIVEARAIVIATGAVNAVPEALDGVRDRVLTNDTVFELDDLPASLAVVGAGPLGIELAAAFSRLGVRTTVFDTEDAIGGLKDPVVGRVAREIMGAELDLKLKVEIKAEPAGDEVRLRWHGQGKMGEGGTGEATFARVLAAAGRKPALDGLDLPASGLTLDKHGVPEFDVHTRRCGDSAIFIAGDADHDRPVLHEASWEGRLAGENAARLPNVAHRPRAAALAITFTSPDMAAIGSPLSALGEDAAIGCCDFDQGRGRIEDRCGGIIRLYARRSDRVIAGGEMIGAGVEHLAHLVAFMVQQKLTAEQALALPFYHPTCEEHLQACLRDLRGQLD